MTWTNRLLAYLAAALALALLAGAGYRAWRTVAGDALAPGPTLAVDAPSGPTEPTTTVSLAAQVPEWHLFGRPPAPGVEAEKPREAVDAPKTRLQLTLRGVAAIERPGEARAIIADPSGTEKRYGVGDAVPGGAQVAEIRADRVMLLRNARFETLPLAKQELSLGPDAGVVSDADAPSVAPAMRPQRQFRMPKPQVARPVDDADVPSDDR
jgi:general secretion pathway protein C